MNCESDIAADINARLDMVRRFAPNLVCLRAALIPFEDIILSEIAGPQPDAAGYDPEEEPYFEVDVMCGQTAAAVVAIRFTAQGIAVQEFMIVKDGKKSREVAVDGPRSITLQGMFNYLRQLPRPVSSF
jgi:hypothetical protein